MGGPWEKYQTTPKVESGPWLKYQAPDQSTGSDTTSAAGGLFSDLGKVGLGFAKGVGEAFNPATIPHDIETVGRVLSYGRVPHPEDANKSLWEKVKSDFSRASQESVIPSPNLDQSAASLRTSIGLVGQMIKNAKIPTTEDVQNTFASELDRQKEFNQKFINPSAEKVGQVAGAGTALYQGGKDVVKLASLGADALSAGKLGEFLKTFSKDKAFDSLKPMGKIANQAIETGRDQVIGEQLLKDKIVTPGASYKNIQERIQNKLDEYGKQIGYFADQADLAAGRDSSIRGVQIDPLQTDIKRYVIEPLIESGGVDEATAVDRWVNNNLAVSAKGRPEVSFSQAQKWKGTLGKTKAKFNSQSDSLSSEAFQAVYDVLNKHIEDGVEKALVTAAPDIQNSFIESKDSYRNLKQAEELIDNTVNRERKNRFFSITDYMAGGATGLAKIVKGAASPASLLTSVAAASANKGLRTRGNQIQAGLADNLSKLFEKDPQGLYKLGDVFDNIGKSGLGVANTIAPADQSIEFTQPSLITPRKK